MPEPSPETSRWARYIKSPLWLDFWASDEVTAKIESLRRDLRRIDGANKDPVNAQLDLLEWLQRLPETMVAREHRESEKSATVLDRTLAHFQRLRTG